MQPMSAQMRSGGDSVVAVEPLGISDYRPQQMPPTMVQQQQPQPDFSQIMAQLQAQQQPPMQQPMPQQPSNQQLLQLMQSLAGK